MSRQTDYRGIDYGMGRSNVDRETGIRYGVISAHSCASWIYDAMADGADYGTPRCPECGGDVVEIPTHTESSNPPGHWVSVIADVPEQYEEYEGTSADYACESCEHMWDSGEVTGDEAIGWKHEADGYLLTDCLDTDVFVLASPYFTYAQYCSPCVPGAGNLDSPLDVTLTTGTWTVTNELACQAIAGNKTYALGPEWFDSDSPMPYRVWRVADGVEVVAEVQS